MQHEVLGPDNAIWDNGEWISWTDINRHLHRLELKERFPNADPELVPLFQDLLSLARQYHHATGRHLNVYGDIGELFGAIAYGIRLHRNYAKGSDGRLGDDFIEVKTITPFKKANIVSVRMDRHFSKLLVVRIDEHFDVTGALVARRHLPRPAGTVLRINWNDLRALV